MTAEVDQSRQPIIRKLKTGDAKPWAYRQLGLVMTARLQKAMRPAHLFHVARSYSF
jgi:hypothetical protein